MSATHTPGPWHQEDGHFRGADGAPLIQGRTIEEIQANRRLIAAAPELLAACQAAAIALKFDWRPIDGTAPHALPLVAQLRAAIKKAKP